ncbi:hypothetical protein ABBQ32_009259 [Trebouxia sp. C0010 RCD-2024]
MHQAPSGSQHRPAAQIFGDRDGFSWQLSGFVHAVPPVRPDEKRVLSHHLSAKTTEMYERAQEGASINVKVLQFFEECQWEKGLRMKLATNVTKWLRQDMAKRKVPFLLGNLPEDPECSDLLEVRPVQEGDFREGLTPGVDVTVHAKAAMPAGTVLGLYRNITVTKAEERTIQENPPQQFQGTTSEWHQKLDAYTADIEQPKPSYKTSKKRFQGIYEDSLKNKPLACLAYMNGNITACINDGCADPLKEDDDSLSEVDAPKDMPANVDLVPVAVGNWPFVFVVTISNIAAGEELFLSYGEGFWGFQRDSFRAIKREKREKREIERELEQARLGPPVETAMSANHGCPATLPYKSFQHAATAPTADMGVDKVASQDLIVPKDENDRQEAAADNQVELQLHESKGNNSQQQGTAEDATAASDLVQPLPIVQESEDGVAPLSKKAKNAVADSPSRSRLAACKAASHASAEPPRIGASTKIECEVMGRAGQQVRPATSSQSQAGSFNTEALLRQQDHDLEVAILHSGSNQISSQPLHNLHNFDGVNAQRSCWAPLRRNDMESISPCVQALRGTARRRQTGSVFLPCLFAPELKQVILKQAELGSTSNNKSKPAGEEGRQSTRQQPRLVLNALDQTNDAQAAHCPPAPTAAQPEQAGQAQLLQPGAEQGTDTCAEQRHLHRLASTTGSTVTQLATPVEAGQQTHTLHRDASLETDMVKPPIPVAHACRKPAGAALSKLESTNSRSNFSFFTPLASTPGQGKTAPPAKAGLHVNGSAISKKLHTHISRRTAHAKQPPGPSRLGISKTSLAKQPDAKSGDVTGIPDGETLSRPWVPGQACHTDSTQEATEARSGDEKAPARFDAALLP